MDGGAELDPGVPGLAAREHDGRGVLEPALLVDPEDDERAQRLVLVPGAGGAAETLRTYLLATPIGAHNLLMRDEVDTDAFLLAPARADILIPLLDAAGK